MANEAIKEEIQKLKEKYVKLEERINNILSENGVENDIKLSEFINNLKVGIDQKEEKIAQLQEQINENQKTDDDKIAKLKRELAQKENQLAQTIKDFQEKEQTQKQEYLQLLTKKDQGWEKELEKALKKPTMVEKEVQTDLTVEQMDKDIKEHEEAIQKEQNKVSALQTKLANLRQEIKDLQDESQENNAERQLLNYTNWKDWKSDNYQNIKRFLETGIMEAAHWDWKQLRPHYQEIRTKLLELVNSLIEGKESQEQLENRNKELEEKLKEGGLNEIEKKLLEIAETPIGTDRSFFGDSKKMIEPKELKKMLQGDKWNQLRADYQAIKKRLIDLADKELETQQNQQKITNLTKKKDKLQTQLDLATKTKEQLAEELQKEKGWLDKIIGSSSSDFSSSSLKKTVSEVKAERERERAGDYAKKKIDDKKNPLNRNWQSFYNWLEKNIVDREAGGPGKGNIKEEKRGEYPEIVSQYHSFVVLMISLEKTIGIPIKTHNNLNQSKIVKMEEYREGKSFAELRKNWEKGYFKPGLYPELDAEFEKLFSAWKKDMDNLP